MSLIYDHDEGCLISHEKFLEECYAEAGLVPKNEMFLINVPYMKEEQARKIYKSFGLSSEVKQTRPSKKLKLDKGCEAACSNQPENCVEVR